MSSKYRATPSYYCPLNGVISNKRLTRCDLHFASKFECEVYALLRKLMPDHKIERQVRLLIKPETTVNHPLYWKCDFRVYHHSNKDGYWNIEAKGFSTKEFLRNLQYLELFSPMDWSRLIVVTNNPELKVKHFTPFSLTQLELFLVETNFLER